MPTNFSFVDQAKANVAISRVGSYAGTVKLTTKYDLHSINVNTHYFLRVNKKLLKQLSIIKQLKCASMT